MENQFEDFILSNNLFSKSDNILVAVSGGIDSMVLLNILLKLDYKISVAHCNFQLRNEESDDDEKFVHDFCKEKKIVAFFKKFETSKYSESNNLSIQMAARELRYNWFNDLMELHHFDFLLTAHNLNDQVETFFINLLRSSGISGLRGIKPKVGKIVRPLLFASRNQIFNYHKINFIKYREDSSNSSDKYLRNYLRHNIIPEMEILNEDFVVNTGKTMKWLSQVESFYKNKMKEEIENLIISTKKFDKIYISQLQNKDNLELYLFEILSLYDFNENQIEDIKNHIVGNNLSGKFISKTHVLNFNRNELLIFAQQDSIPIPDRVYQIDSNTKHIILPIHLSFQNIEGNIYLNDSPNLAYLDAEKLIFPLVLRKWKIGDRFYPLGMNQSKKLSDFFINIKLASFEKEQIWVLCSDDKIVWVVGYRIDNRYKVTKNTKHIFKIELNGTH